MVFRVVIWVLIDSFEVSGLLFSVIGLDERCVYCGVKFVSGCNWVLMWGLVRFSGIGFWFRFSVSVGGSCNWVCIGFSGRIEIIVCGVLIWLNVVWICGF